MQVVKGDLIVFFNQIFDAVCKLSADSDANVQSAAHLLDRLVKVNSHQIFQSIHLIYWVFITIYIYVFSNLAYVFSRIL